MSVYEKAIINRAEKKAVKVVIDYDTDPLNPREEYGAFNVATMYCWHSRYNLGDIENAGKLYYGEDSKKFAMVRDYINNNPDYFPKQAHKLVTSIEEWIDNAPYDYDEKELEKKVDYLLETYFYWHNLFLYDHSGITMSVGRFSCPWDSGQVGFIIVAKSKARKEWAKPAKNVKEKEHYENYLASEVKEYDMYLTGEVYGFQLYEASILPYDENMDDDEMLEAIEESDEWEETDSCWGFFGDYKESMKGNGFDELLD